MPTVNPRVNVTLSPSTDELVSRLAALQRVSKSQVLRELLTAAEPALQRAAALMEAATKARGEVLDGLARSLESAQDRIEVELAAHLKGLDEAVGDLVQDAQAIRPRRPARAAQAARPGASAGARREQDPPASNRGVRIHRKGGR